MVGATSVKELLTFTIPQGGSTSTLNRLLDDLEIQDPKDTKTYFKPLAEFLNEFLKRVRLEPVVIVVSDGKSDNPQNKSGVKEVPFENLGTRGVYVAPGMTGWKVAIQGGKRLDLTGLFQRPVGTRAKANAATSPLAPVIDPCLIEPELIAETNEKIVFRPRRFSNIRDGSVTLWLRHNCVARFRSFKVELHSGNKRLDVGSNKNSLIDQSPRSFTFPVHLSAREVEPGEATLLVSVDYGGVTKTIYPNPAVVTIEEASYWSEYGIFWGGVFAVTVFLLSAMMAACLSYRKRKRNSPEIVKVFGGPGVPLYHGQPRKIGGEGCEIVIPGVSPGEILATVDRTASKGVITLRPESGVRIKVDGIDSVGSAIYRLGYPLQVIGRDGSEYPATLLPGTSKDIAFSMTFPGGNSTVGVRGSPGFDDMSFPGADSVGFGGNSAEKTTGSYI